MRESIPSHREQACIDKWIYTVGLDEGLSDYDKLQFEQWIRGLGEYSLYSSTINAFGEIDEFPFAARKLSDCIDFALDGTVEDGVLNEEDALLQFKSKIEDLDEDYCRYLVSLLGSSGDVAWILVTSEGRGQGGFEDTYYDLFSTQLDAEQYLRDEGFVFPNTKTPSGRTDKLRDDDIIKLIRNSCILSKT